MDNLNTLDNVSKNTHTKLFKSQFSGASDNKVWWDYIRFNTKYYPEKLEDPTLITVIPECCNVSCKVPPEQIREWHGEKTIPCPICNKGSLFEIVDEKREIQ